jgi:hypothetical protein
MLLGWGICIGDKQPAQVNTAGSPCMWEQEQQQQQQLQLGALLSLCRKFVHTQELLWLAVEKETGHMSAMLNAWHKLSAACAPELDVA